MTIQEHDARCNELSRKLEALRADGQGGTFVQTQPDGKGVWHGVTREFTETPATLTMFTSERLASIGLGSKRL